MKRSTKAPMPTVTERSIPTFLVPKLEPGTTAFNLGECAIMLAHSHVGWHMSISHPERYPTWDEVAEARYQLIPDHSTMAMLLPPKSKYVNVHPNVFHLWEVRDPDNGPAVFPAKQ